MPIFLLLALGGVIAFAANRKAVAAPAPEPEAPRPAPVNAFFRPDASKKIDPMFAVNELFVLLLREPDPIASAQDKTSAWRRTLGDTFFAINRENGPTGKADARAFADGVRFAVQNQFKFRLNDPELYGDEDQRALTGDVAASVMGRSQTSRPYGSYGSNG